MGDSLPDSSIKYFGFGVGLRKNPHQVYNLSPRSLVPGADAQFISVVLYIIDQAEQLTPTQIQALSRGSLWSVVVAILSPGS